MQVKSDACLIIEMTLARFSTYTLHISRQRRRSWQCGCETQVASSMHLPETSHDMRELHLFCFSVIPNDTHHDGKYVNVPLMPDV